jgi:polyhydroxyalkanoate synthesis regulator phasin
VAKKQKKGGKTERSRADSVRAAVEQAFEATAQGAGPVRERAQELADELSGAATRFREVLEELRPWSPDEVAKLRERVAALEARVGELEAARAAAPAPARRAPAKPRATAAKPRATAAKPRATASKPRTPRTPPAAG